MKSRKNLKSFTPAEKKKLKKLKANQRKEEGQDQEEESEDSDAPVDLEGTWWMMQLRT